MDNKTEIGYPAVGLGMVMYEEYDGWFNDEWMEKAGTSENTNNS